MIRELTCFVTIFFAFFDPGLAQCLKTNVSVDPEVVGKRMVAPAGCSPVGNECDAVVRVERWGIFYKPTFCRSYPKLAPCPEHIVFLFRIGDKPAVLLHRPLLNSSYFASIYPKAYKVRIQNVNDFSQCSRIPVQRIMAWGSDRSKFIKLVRRAYTGILRIRDFNCDGIYGNPNGSKSRSEVKKLIASKQVPSAALNYLYALAHANYFCV